MNISSSICKNSQVVLYVSMFEYTLKFCKTMEHTNADALSRLPIPVEPATTDTPPELVLLINHLADPPVTASLGLVKIQNFARLYSFYVKVGLWRVTVRKVQN